MSNDQWWIDDADDDEVEEAPPAPAPRDLRAQLKAVLKKNKELENQLSSARGEARRANIGNYFREKGINPKLAKYIPPDIDPTPEALDKWVSEDGELFNIRPSVNGNENEAPESPEGAPVLPGADGLNVTPDVQAGWNAIGAGTANALPPDKVKDLEAAINGASNQEELKKILFSHGAGTGFSGF